MSLKVVLIFATALLATSSEEPPRFSASETVDRALLSLRRTVAIEKYAALSAALLTRRPVEIWF